MIKAKERSRLPTLEHSRLPLAASTQVTLAKQELSKMTLNGTWHIYEMEMWDQDYFNMEVQAYITVNEGGMGQFQFGLVMGSLDGEIVNADGTQRFEFTWEGNDEYDDASGSGWLTLKTADELAGKIKLHGGDSSLFKAKKAG